MSTLLLNDSFETLIYIFILQFKYFFFDESNKVCFCFFSSLKKYLFGNAITQIKSLITRQYKYEWHPIIHLYISFVGTVAQANKCIPKKFEYDSIVCVCNATYCDSTPHETLENGHFQWYISSKSGHRLNYVSKAFSRKGTQNGTVLIVNNSITYQKIQGWGAAFTDSAGINIKKLSPEAQNILMRWVNTKYLLFVQFHHFLFFF